MFMISIKTNCHGERYMVEFEEDEPIVMTEEELLNFVSIAVINNKDIPRFSVARIQDVDVDEYGQAHYIY